MWGDAKFRSLSAPKPNARDLWIFLLTGPHNTAVPGLFALGEAAMAEAMGWPLAATKACLAEILGKGMMKMDQGTRLVWLPNALRHNAPENPNVVQGWKLPWSELPECGLKDEAREALLVGLQAISAKFNEAFRIALGELPPKPSSNPAGYPSEKRPPKPSPKPSVKPSPKDPPKGSPKQEPEPDQEEEAPPPPAPSIVAPDAPAGAPDAGDVVAALLTASDGHVVTGSTGEQAAVARVLTLRHGADLDLVREVGSVLRKPEVQFPTWDRIVRSKRITLGQLLGKHDGAEYEARALDEVVAVAQGRIEARRRQRPPSDPPPDKPRGPVLTADEMRALRPALRGAA